MSRRVFGFILSFALFCAGFASAQGLSGLARFDPEGSGLSQSGKRVTLELNLSQPVPYRAYTLNNPPRLVLDFKEVDWAGADASALGNVSAVSEARFGGFRPGWSRMVLKLSDPYLLGSVEMVREADTGTARLVATLQQTNIKSFNEVSGMPEGGDWPEAVAPTGPVKQDGRVLVVLDPGHGGIDPGAVRGEVDEKGLMLTFAREVADELRRIEGVDVLLTRSDDSFVSLERRVAIAHQAGADLFISLHADALAHGSAHGATVHTLADDASDKASELLAERHDRADLLSGNDLSGQDDVVADVLLDLARQETHPRSLTLANALIEGLGGVGAPLNRRPHRSAAFSVLKAADIPSVLLEIGFMSSDRDFANIVDADWRAQKAIGIRNGIQAWLISDEAMRRVVRQ